MHRRALLTAGGAALAGLAGCDSPQGTATRTPDRTTERGSLSVAFDALQPVVVELFVDAYEFAATGGSQYLFLTDLDARASEHRFRFDGVEFEPGVDTSYDLVRAPSEFGGPTEASDWTVFELPETGDAGDAALVGPDGEWRPDDTLRERLAAPLPSLSVTAFETPSSVDAGSRPTVTVTVSNEGDTDGRFLGILRPPAGSLTTGQLVSRLVPAGERVTLTATGDRVEPPTPGRGQGNTLTYELDWPDGSDTTTIAVE